MNRRSFFKIGGLVCAAGLPQMAYAADSPTDAIENIRTRRSVRAFSPVPISGKDLKTILECAMLAPSAVNEQPWDYVVITDADVLAKVPEINHYASFARNAPLAILVCLNTDKEQIPGMGIIDVSMSSQNILLAAHALGLGSVFTGIYPDEARMKGFSELVGLPENAIPIGLIVIGYPEDGERKPVPDRYDEANIHMQKWSK